MTVPLDLFRKQPSGQQSFALNSSTSESSPEPGPGLGSISAEVLLHLDGLTVDLLLQEVLLNAHLVLWTVTRSAVPFVAEFRVVHSDCMVTLRMGFVSIRRISCLIFEC